MKLVNYFKVFLDFIDSEELTSYLENIDKYTVYSQFLRISIPAVLEHWTKM